MRIGAPYAPTDAVASCTRVGTIRLVHLVRLYPVAVCLFWLIASCDFSGVRDHSSSTAACVAAGAEVCTAVACDDDEAASNRLSAGSLDCFYAGGGSKTWADARAYCLGAGFRLPTKGEADALVANPSICATPIRDPGGSAVWGAWTGTCAEVNRAWVVGTIEWTNDQPRHYVNDQSNVVCVR